MNILITITPSAMLIVAAWLIYGAWTTHRQRKHLAAMLWLKRAVCPYDRARREFWRVTFLDHMGRVLMFRNPWLLYNETVLGVMK